MQPIIDEWATPEQREALFAILSGKNSAEGTLFHIMSLIVSKIHDPMLNRSNFPSTRTEGWRALLQREFSKPK